LESERADFPSAADPSLRRDILSAYAASIARVLSWVIVSALVYRRSPDEFAMLALVRGTLGILNYCSLGLLPAMIQAFARIPSTPGKEGQRVGGASAPAPTNLRATVLHYATPQTIKDQDRGNREIEPKEEREIATAGWLIACGTWLVGLGATLVCALNAYRIFRIPEEFDLWEVRFLLIFIGIGNAGRWLSEPAAATLQTRGRITRDNACLIIADAVWVVGVVVVLVSDGRIGLMGGVAAAYLVSGYALAILRSYGTPSVNLKYLKTTSLRFVRPLLATGLLITLAQLADYLYAPTDYILINRLLSPLDLAAYAPAIQIDAGLMILVTGLASVLLPKAALAHAAGDRRGVRRYYVRGTLASAAMLAIAAILVWIPSPLIFKIWFGNPMDTTRAVLPLVLCHTVIGGSSAVGRSILLALGRTRPFTVSALLAGLTNVAASYAFVRYLHLGLAGIVLGTIVAVVARCGIWMPWYILRELRERAPSPSPAR
jgi:O-antigen/teichoic acid export membrane protein